MRPSGCNELPVRHRQYENGNYDNRNINSYIEPL